MKLRSLLFVPGDRPDRMEKALASAADALIIDLEDSVATSAKPLARSATAAFLASAERQRPLLVRVNPLGSGMTDADLDIILDSRPDGLVLPKAEGAGSVRALAAKCGGIPILPIATETPAAIFQLASYADVRDLLFGLTWGAEDLSAAIGATSSHNDDGSYTAPYELARSLTLLAGTAADVPVFDTVFTTISDEAGVAQFASRACRDGFSGMLAIHPNQLPLIHAAFTPTMEELRSAKAIVEAFEANPGSGALRVEGSMVDAPHLKRARRILQLSSGDTK